MNKIKIVTAFFDIGRNNSNTLPRSNDQYFEYFRFWARIQNEMVIYCEPSNAERIINIRQDYGLEDRTTIIAVDDVYSIEPEIFGRMRCVELDPSFRSFRFYENALSNTAKYDYVMLLKWWCVADAAKRSDEDCFYAWIDFGYNHGGDRYTNSSDFDFYWRGEKLSANKINVFCLSDPNRMSVIDSLQFQKDCFIGHSVIMTKELCSQYWSWMKQEMLSLLEIGCIDDDQQLQLMAYKSHQDEHSVTICDWFEDFELDSNHHFEVRKKELPKIQEKIENRKCSIVMRIKNKLLWCYRRIKYPNYPERKEHPFIIRMKGKMKKYYHI